jgi:hypothetical protein
MAEGGLLGIIISFTAFPLLYLYHITNAGKCQELFTNHFRDTLHNQG